MFKFNLHDNNTISKFEGSGIPKNFINMKAIVLFYNEKTGSSSTGDLTATMFDDLLTWYNHDDASLPLGQNLKHKYDDHKGEELSIVVSYCSNPFNDLVEYVDKMIPFYMIENKKIGLKSNMWAADLERSNKYNYKSNIKVMILFYNHKTKVSSVKDLSVSYFNDLLVWYNMCTDDENIHLPIGTSLNHEFEDYEGSMVSIVVKY